MTAASVRKLMKANGIEGEVTGRGTSFEVEVPNDKMFRKLKKVVRGLGGFKCGHGGWCLRPDFRIETKDYSDPSSVYHY